MSLIEGTSVTCAISEKQQRRVWTLNDLPALSKRRTRRRRTDCIKSTFSQYKEYCS